MAEHMNMHAMPATRPSTTAPIGPENPDAGVTATRPATAPDAPPSRLGLPLLTLSASIHASAAAAVATKVLIMASAAVPLASSAEPALKPNQPTQSSAAPMSVMVSEWGGMASRPNPTRLPTSRAPMKPAIPELMWTTVPPAKSIAPHWKASPALADTASMAACAAALASGAALARAFAACTVALGPAQYQTI